MAPETTANAADTEDEWSLDRETWHKINPHLGQPLVETDETRGLTIIKFENGQEITTRQPQDSWTNQYVTVRGVTLMVPEPLLERAHPSLLQFHKGRGNVRSPVEKP